jgi:hypothetical protein
MPRVCTVCSHKERQAIDRRLIDGGTYRAIAQEFGLSLDAVRRHRLDHLTKALVKAAEARPIARAETLLDRLEALINDCRRIGESALEAGKHGPAVQALKAVTSNLELIARLTGQLGEGSTTVNIALVQQAKSDGQELARLKRLTPAEREQLRALLSKMDGCAQAESVFHQLSRIEAGERVTVITEVVTEVLVSSHRVTPDTPAIGF